MQPPKGITLKRAEVLEILADLPVENGDIVCHKDGSISIRQYSWYMLRGFGDLSADVREAFNRAGYRVATAGSTHRPRQGGKMGYYKVLVTRVRRMIPGDPGLGDTVRVKLPHGTPLAEITAVYDGGYEVEYGSRAFERIADDQVIEVVFSDNAVGQPIYPVTKSCADAVMPG